MTAQEIAMRLREISLDMDPDDIDKALFMEGAFMLEEFGRFVNETYRRAYTLHERWDL